MSYSLKTPENTVIDLGDGNAITAKPLTTPVLEAAKAVARRLAREARASADVMTGMGLAASDVADDDISEGLYDFFLRIELGVRLITAWQGFGDEEAAEASPENIRTVFTLYPVVAAKFYRGLMAKLVAAADVKKNSVTAAPGTSSAGAEIPTAPAAAA